MDVAPQNETGNPVDWWFLYKIPKLTGGSDKVPAATGYEYAYYDDIVENVVQSANTLDNGKGALNLTLDSIFNSPDGSTGWILYNDERPPQAGGADNSDLGHTKGVIAFDVASNTALWLLHSWPKYAYPGARLMPTPMFGQTFLCVSLDLPTAEELAAQMITHQQPQVFDSKLPTGLANTSPLYQLTQPINPADLGNAKTIDLTTRGGMPFEVIAKNRDWGLDFWNDLVGPTIGEDINVETWIRGQNVIPPILDSDGIHKTFDIKYITLKAIGMPWAWPEVKDHAKWAISYANNWICVGDINRMISQEKRGGCTIAFQDKDLWAILNKTDLIVAPTGMSDADARTLVKTTNQSLKASLLHKPAPTD